MIMFNEQQIMGLIRGLIITFGGVLAGAVGAWAAAKCNGCVTSEQVLSAINSPAFIGIIGSVVTMIVGFISRTPTKQIDAVAKLDNPNGPGKVQVVTDPQTANITLAANPNVVPVKP